MELLALHIYHLDDDEECDKVIALLRSAGVGDEWTIERPTEQANAIFVPINLDPRQTQTLEEGQIAARKIEKSLRLLRALKKEAIDSIKALDLDAAMRIVTDAFYPYLPENLVSECGRLGLQICVFNSRALRADAVKPNHS